MMKQNQLTIKRTIPQKGTKKISHEEVAKATQNYLDSGGTIAKIPMAKHPVLDWDNLGEWFEYWGLL
jgi:hypothetical protein